MAKPRRTSVARYQIGRDAGLFRRYHGNDRRQPWPGLVAIARIDHFAGNVVAAMTEAVLSKVDLPPKVVLANLQNLTAEARTLGNALGERQEETQPFNSRSRD